MMPPTSQTLLGFGASWLSTFLPEGPTAVKAAPSSGAGLTPEAPLGRSGADLGPRASPKAKAPAAPTQGTKRARRSRRKTVNHTAEGFPSYTTSDHAEWRKHGFWAVDTFNPNAWSSASDYMEKASADAALLQETRETDKEKCKRL